MPNILSVTQWLTDFSLRVKQFEKISTAFSENGLSQLRVGKKDY